MNPLTGLKQRLNRLGDDERAVSPVIGFVLIFALIMIVFTLYQTNVVPAQNSEVEFKHSQTVETQMSQLNDLMGRTGSTGVSQSMTVVTGVQYPDRALALNPGAPTGSLRASSSTYSVGLENAKASGQDGKYFDPSAYPDAFKFESKELVYGVNYNEYHQNPTITLAPGLKFTQFQSGSVVNSADIITGNRIDLTLLDPASDYQQSAMTASVDVKPTSATADYMTIEPDGGDPEITVHSSLSLDAAGATNLEDTLKSNEKVKNAVYSSSANTVTLTLKQQSYQLRVADVGIGSSDKPDAHYLVSDTPMTQTVSLGEAATFTVTARDKFGNPVSGAALTAAVDKDASGGDGSFDGPETKTTNADGQATFSFRPNRVTAQPIKVDVSLDDGSGDTDLSTVRYTVDAKTRQGFIDNGFGIDVTIDSVDLSGDHQLEIVFDNTRSEDVTAKTIQLNGFLSKKNKPVTSATLGSTTIPFNQGPVALGGDEFVVPGDGSKTITLDLDDKPNGVGLLIADLEFKSASGQTLTATYATNVDST